MSAMITFNLTDMAEDYVLKTVHGVQKRLNVKVRYELRYKLSNLKYQVKLTHFDRIFRNKLRRAQERK
jgi:hypothetical protein